MIDLWDLGASPSTKQSEMDKMGCGTELSGGQVTGQPAILVLGVLVPSKWMTALGASVLELAPSLGLIRSLLPDSEMESSPFTPSPGHSVFLSQSHFLSLVEGSPGGNGLSQHHQKCLQPHRGSTLA